MIGTTRAGLPTHERLPDLLAASDDPHPRKTRRIEFVGDRSPFDDERVQANLLLGRYTPTMEQAIRLASFRAVVRIHKFSERLMEHNHQYALSPHKHLGRTYCWHAGNDYIEDVDYGDVDAILGGPSGHQFRDVTDGVPPPEVKTFSPEVFKLIAVDFVVEEAPTGAPSGQGSSGQGSQQRTILAAH
jgi:hypothetical protein